MLDNLVGSRGRIIRGGIVLFVILLAIGGYLLYRDWALRHQKQDEQQKRDQAYLQAMLYNNPEPMQQLFLEDVRKKINDNYAKSDAYFVTHRYFDNGGNIYEIYDYVNSHSELAFLKDAEKIYPIAFDSVRLKLVPAYSNRLSLHAYLAYLEVMVDNGYGGIAMRSTLANQYAKLAWIAKKNPKQFVDVPDLGKYYDARIGKALHYASSVRGDVESIVKNEPTPNVIPDRDNLVGLNQYAAALRTFESLGVSFESSINATQIFDYAADFANDHAAELYLFTHFLNASTLLMASPKNTESMKIALRPIYSAEPEKRGSLLLKKILDSRNDQVLYVHGSTEFTVDDYELYGKANVVSLARRVPEFKTWLLSKGWKEGDFEYPTAF